MNLIWRVKITSNKNYKKNKFGETSITTVITDIKKFIQQ